jgi:hypothetical protein
MKSNAKKLMGNEMAETDIQVWSLFLVSLLVFVRLIIWLVGFYFIFAMSPSENWFKSQVGQAWENGRQGRRVRVRKRSVHQELHEVAEFEKDEGCSSRGRQARRGLCDAGPRGGDLLGPLRPQGVAAHEHALSPGRLFVEDEDLLCVFANLLQSVGGVANSVAPNVFGPAWQVEFHQY